MSGPIKIRHFLIPLGWLFGTIARFRRWLFKKGILRSYAPSIPVVCVGNIAIGGTGKTPHAGYVVNLLSQEHQVAMLSRGYGRKSKGYVLANTTPLTELSAELIGDEPLLLHQRFPQLPLAVDGDRREGVIRLQEYAPQTDVVVMDDAYQHLSFSPTLKMILTEFENPYFKDYPMPAGRLREFPCAVAEADMVLVTKVNVPVEQIDRAWWRQQLNLRDDQPLFFTHYSYVKPEPVTESAQTIDMDKPLEVVLMTGIARPKPLLEHLKKQYNILKHLDFPDHHHYSNFEISQIGDTFFKNPSGQRVIFTTEKDWMRLQNESVKKLVSLLPIFIVPIQVEFLFENDQVAFNKIIESHVRREKNQN